MSAETNRPTDRADSTEASGDLPRTEVSAHRTPDESTVGMASSAEPTPASSDEADLPRLQPGESLAGRFTILRFIARGGMGAVYEANDVMLRSRVALKVIRGRIGTDATVMERFRREVLLARRIGHPNVCHVYELFDATAATGMPIHLLTMELLEGETLARRIARQGRMSPAEVLPVLKQMAAALDAAHAAGVVHRDFKTSNVMLVPWQAGDTNSAEKRVVVTDFGIARALRPDATTAEKVTGTGLLGTPEYMAPEQVTRGEVGPAADIYALGLVLYEMLTGKTPFASATPLETAVRRLNERPEPPKTSVPDLTERWNTAVLKCLERDPARRFSTASAVERFVEKPPVMVRRRLMLSVAAMGLAVIVLLLAAAAWFGGWFGIRKDEKWLRTEVIPELHRLVASNHIVAAHLLAMKANAALPNNATLAAAWRTFAAQVTIKTAPPGAHVWFREYDAANTPWHELGVTPLATWYPRGLFRLRFELEGYRRFEGAMQWWWFQPTVIPLDKVGTLADNLVHVPGGQFGPGPEGHELQLNDYLLDRYEVTNRRYKAFVAAGGYERQEFWREPFLRDGRQMRWDEAMTLFTDRTGRPGPSTWELSSFPRGQDDYPVSGVSWYEAAAFAAFEGRELPTFFHWLWASGTWGARWMVPASNFGDKGLARVGQYQGIGPFGTFDTAGNVREWCLNQATGGAQGRFILGGGWNDAAYSFVDTASQSPWDRSQTNGMRLVTYLGTNPNLEKAKQPVDRPFRDYSKEKPVADAEFRIYQRMYAYDRRPLNAVVEGTDSSNEYWLREKVSFDAAYGKDRVTAYLFLPKVGNPPYQTVIYFPGSQVLFESSIEEELAYTDWDFIVRSGRALMFPVYRGTLERQAERNRDVFLGTPTDSVAYRDSVIQWSQDLSRSIDYLETRHDIDKEKFGYFGYSWGAALGALIPAIEPRLKAGVLHVAGLQFERSLPEVDPFNFVTHVTIPMLMLNGRFDPYFPIETAQRPMFELLGTPSAQKRWVIYDAGHFVPRDPLIKETLDWYDRYLGSLKDLRRAAPASQEP